MRFESSASKTARASAMPPTHSAMVARARSDGVSPGAAGERPSSSATSRSKWAFEGGVSYHGGLCRACLMMRADPAMQLRDIPFVRYFGRARFISFSDRLPG